MNLRDLAHVPHKRFTFDYIRRVTALPGIVDALRAEPAAYSTAMAWKIAAQIGKPMLLIRACGKAGR